MRLDHQEIFNSKNYADSVGKDVELITFKKPTTQRDCLQKQNVTEMSWLGFFEGVVLQDRKMG